MRAGGVTTHTYPDDSYTAWCRDHGCDHAHCPRWECEHPQPLMVGGVLACGYCWFRRGEVTAMVPCGPETCD